MSECTNKSQLTKLYNTNVAKAEYVTRPWTSSDYKAGKGVPFLHHAGVRLTLDNGDQYLLHKGPNYGKSSDTVVTPASNMKQSNWTTEKTADVRGKTVNDFMKNALPEKEYSVLRGNHCQTAAKSAFSITKK